MFETKYTEDDVELLYEALNRCEADESNKAIIDKPEILEKALCEVFPEVGNEMKKCRRNAVYLNKCSHKQGDIPVGASKVGGLPDLSPDVDFPTITGYTYTPDNGETEVRPELPMHLVCQIDLRELAESGTDIDGTFPKTGMLYLFWSGELFPEFFKPDNDGDIKLDDPSKTDIYKIFIWNGDMSTLKRTEPPMSYSDDDIFDEECSEYRIEFANDFEYAHNELCDIEGFFDLTEDIDIPKAQHETKLLGVPCGANTPDLNKDDVQLCQLSYQVGCVWELFWIMKKEDLLNGDFSDVRLRVDMD